MNKVDNCLFCDVQTVDRKRIIDENSLAYAVRDGFPVTDGHTLFIPKRHTLDYFGLGEAEVLAINNLTNLFATKIPILSFTLLPDKIT